MKKKERGEREECVREEKRRRKEQWIANCTQVSACTFLRYSQWLLTCRTIGQGKELELEASTYGYGKNIRCQGKIEIECKTKVFSLWLSNCFSLFLFSFSPSHLFPVSLCLCLFSSFSPSLTPELSLSFSSFSLFLLLHLCLLFIHQRTAVTCTTYSVSSLCLVCSVIGNVICGWFTKCPCPTSPMADVPFMWVKIRRKRRAKRKAQEKKKEEEAEELQTNNCTRWNVKVNHVESI